MSTSAAAGHGALAIEVVPNPVVATRVSDDTYDFPLEVVVRETGGHPVDIATVTANVFGPANIQVATETYDAARIGRLGYPTHVPANGELRYRFDQKRTVPDERLFSGVSADIRVDGRDEAGTATSATTRVSIRR